MKKRVSIPMKMQKVDVLAKHALRSLWLTTTSSILLLFRLSFKKSLMILIVTVL